MLRNSYRNLYVVLKTLMAWRRPRVEQNSPEVSVLESVKSEAEAFKEVAAERADWGSLYPDGRAGRGGGAMAVRGKTSRQRDGSEVPASSLDVHRTISEQKLPGGPIRKL